MSQPFARVGSRRRVDGDALDAAIAGYHRIERVTGWSLALCVAADPRVPVGRRRRGS